MRWRHAMIALCLFVTAGAAAAAENGVEVWRAPDGATLWRYREAGVVRWEIADVDGDGRPDIAIFRCGERYTRVEIDTTGGPASDRIYLFNPDGTSVGYLDEHGDGVLEKPAGAKNEREQKLHEVGRGGQIFKKALDLRYRADAGLLTAVDAPAPTAWPPFARPTGVEVPLNVRLTLIPGGPTKMLERQDNPGDMASFDLKARVGEGKTFSGLNVHVRPDVADERRTIPGKLSVDLYPVWTLEPMAEGPSEKVMVLQLTGHLTAPGVYDELFFFTAPLTGNRPATLNVPMHDRAGRQTSSMLIEVRREES